MINELVEGISAALGEEFGEACNIRSEDAGQELEAPCFFIHCTGSSRELIRGGRHRWTHSFRIRYFPLWKEQGYRECYETADRMMDCLEHVAFGATYIRGAKMRHELDTDAGILNFYVNYDCITVRAEDSVSMDGMASRVDAKAGG